MNAEKGDGSQIGGIKNLVIRIEDQLTRSINLKAIGGGQYRGESKVAFGDASFYLDQNVWQANIPENLKDQKVTFLLDLSDQNQPYMVFFQKQ